jgi:hypothetical protein
MCIAYNAQRMAWYTQVRDKQEMVSFNASVSGVSMVVVCKSSAAWA